MVGHCTWIYGSFSVSNFATGIVGAEVVVWKDRVVTNRNDEAPL